jgi:hypothetical protein
MNDHARATFLGRATAARHDPAALWRRLAVLEILEAARAALLGRLGSDGLDLRLLGFARFLARSLLSLGHLDSLLVTLLLSYSITAVI